jgi:hypothetical protein
MIIGISEYQNLPGWDEPPRSRTFGLHSLSGAARSADAVYRWILNAKLPVPLKTCRLMVAPSGEEDDIARSNPPTLEDFLRELHEWRGDAAENQTSMTFFYFCGQGVEIAREPVIALQDFAQPIGPLLRGTVPVANIVNGMGPSIEIPDVARTQFYFIDTCRHQATLKPYEAMNSSLAFDVDLGNLDDRSAPVFYAAAPGALAWLINHQDPPYGRSTYRSVFSEALISCLSGAAAIPRQNEYGDITWVVSVSSLVEGIQSQVDGVLGNRGAQLSQLVTVSGAVRDSIICIVDKPPPIGVTIELVPSWAVGGVDVTVTDAAHQVVFQVQRGEMVPHPYRVNLLPGLYRLHVTPPSGRTFEQVRDVLPPTTMWKVRVDT